MSHPRRYGVYNAALPEAGCSRFAACYLCPAKRWPTRPLKGMSGAPTSGSIRSAPPERGMAYRTRVPGSQSPRSSQRRGEPATGRRGTGGTTSERRRVRDGQLPEPSGGRLTGELLDIERVPSSSERGRRKSACEGNSLAAYSISRTVLRGGGGGNAAPLPEYRRSSSACNCCATSSPNSRRGECVPRSGWRFRLSCAPWSGIIHPLLLHRADDVEP